MVLKRDSLIDLLGSRSRLKILSVLWRAKEEELTVYKICKLTGLKRNVTYHHLKLLTDGGLVNKRIYGRIPLFKINSERKEGKALADFFRKVMD